MGNNSLNKYTVNSYSIGESEGGNRCSYQLVVVVLQPMMGRLGTCVYIFNTCILWPKEFPAMRQAQCLELGRLQYFFFLMNSVYYV